MDAPTRRAASLRWNLSLRWPSGGFILKAPVTVLKTIRARSIAACCAFVPAVAYANAGIGFLLLGVPVMLLALIPAILLEALILQRMLGGSLKPALWLSAWANLWSTLVGGLLAVLVDFTLMSASGSSGLEPTKLAVTIVLAPLFLITVWIESQVLLRRLSEMPRTRVVLAAVVANLASYLVMLVTVWASAIFPEQGSLITRTRLSEGIATASPKKNAVEVFWAKHGRFPDNDQALGELPQKSKWVEVSVSRGGRIDVLVHMPTEPEIHNRHVWLVPEFAGGTLLWKCTAPEVSDSLLPLACRKSVR